MDLMIIKLTIDTTVSTVCSPSHLGSTVNLNMLNDETVGFQTTDVSVGFRVLQKLQKEFSRFLRPSSLGCSPLFSLYNKE